MQTEYAKGQVSPNLKTLPTTLFYSSKHKPIEDIHNHNSTRMNEK